MSPYQNARLSSSPCPRSMPLYILRRWAPMACANLRPNPRIGQDDWGDAMPCKNEEESYTCVVSTSGVCFSLETYVCSLEVIEPRWVWQTHIVAFISIASCILHSIWHCVIPSCKTPLRCPACGIKHPLPLSQVCHYQLSVTAALTGS